MITEVDTIGMRRDSPLTVPEPELALWITAHGEIADTSCNDMTSLSVEAASPPYLPQGTVYRSSCARSSGIVPAEVPDATSLAVRSTITRGMETVWSAETSTASMARSFEELVGWLMAEPDFHDGAILSTGTGIVPDLDIVLEPGDIVRIEIEGIGDLTNIAGFVGDR